MMHAYVVTDKDRNLVAVEAGLNAAQEACTKRWKGCQIHTAPLEPNCGARFLYTMSVGEEVVAHIRVIPLRLEFYKEIEKQWYFERANYPK